VTRFAAASLSLGCLLVPARAGAVEVTVGKHPLLIDVTNSAIFDYHFDNRDFAAGNVSTLLNDNYFEWLDRFNVQASFWRFRLGFRLDGATFAGTPKRESIEELVAEQPQSGQNDYRNQILREIHSRYLRTYYPSKLFIAYIRPGLELTLGDFYAQLGRGLVFSVRKIDELAVDTTVRGAKVTAQRDYGSFRLGSSLFVGQMNPLRVDEVTGRRLHGERSALFFGFPGYGNLRTIESDGTSPVAIQVTDRGRPSYIADTVLGMRIEGGPKFAQGALNSSLLARSTHTEDYLRCRGAEKDEIKGNGTLVRGECAAQFPDFTPPPNDTSKKYNTIATFSGSLNLPSIADKHGDVYLEVASQRLRDGHIQGFSQGGLLPERTPDLSGYAIYASGSGTGGPLSVSLEGKHYRRFVPLSANVDTTTKAFGAPELNSLVYYSQPPTAEPIYVEPVSGGAPNVCVTGGRGRVDYRYNRATSVYAWLGRYASWSEIRPANADCKIDDELKTNTWDVAFGADLAFEQMKSHIGAWIGGRTTDSVVLRETRAGRTDTFYREGYIRYDAVKHIKGPFSLHVQGLHRRRFEPDSFEKPWYEGENYTVLQWSPHLSAIFGDEYLFKEGCRARIPATNTRPAQPSKNVCHFLNGGLQWRSQSQGGVLGQIFDTVAVFVGQRRGALRCVSGVCRQFPPFEGAKLELTSRF
jgi:hypothetical protein